ncbi:MAG: N-alpha-acetyl diaminobutyric acid deacetylase DoeB [Alphaproteobacteria bacterium]|nr:N-alpha-acetyl diaminobutyric acid deacetylase DoeB [Alphaproteobacteria bacterium]
MRVSAVTPTIALDAKGKHHGHLVLPHSRDDSAWGSIRIPITIIGNGTGPTALLSGANHGDEYEGPLALLDLARTLEPSEVSGRLIIVPFLNFPAFRAGKRTSPIDAGNMNRAFPGRPDGTITEKIADYVQRYLLPMADIVLDFHSGGKTLEFLPYAACHILENKAQEARCRAARDAFNAPCSLEMIEIDAVGMYDTAAEEMGKTFVTTELGGGGTCSPQTVAIARKGARNLLIHAGILTGTPEIGPSQHLTQPDIGSYYFAPQGGLCEHLVTLGQTVCANDVLARIWDCENTGLAPREIRAEIDAILITRHQPGLIQSGDCIAVLATQTN